MTEQELYDNGVTSSGRGYCPNHGWIASLNSEGDIWCPRCGWVNLFHTDTTHNGMALNI